LNNPAIPPGFVGKAPIIEPFTQKVLILHEAGYNASL